MLIWTAPGEEITITYVPNGGGIADSNVAPMEAADVGGAGLSAEVAKEQDVRPKSSNPKKSHYDALLEKIEQEAKQLGVDSKDLHAPARADGVRNCGDVPDEVMRFSAFEPSTTWRWFKRRGYLGDNDNDDQYESDDDIGSADMVKTLRLSNAFGQGLPKGWLYWQRRIRDTGRTVHFWKSPMGLNFRSAMAVNEFLKLGPAARMRLQYAAVEHNVITTQIIMDMATTENAAISAVVGNGQTDGVEVGHGGEACKRDRDHGGDETNKEKDTGGNGDGDGNLPLPGSGWRQRQKALYSYGFVCACSRCLDEQGHEL